MCSLRLLELSEYNIYIPISCLLIFSPYFRHYNKKMNEEPMEVDQCDPATSKNIPLENKTLSEEEKRCSICLDDFTDKKVLDKCTHPFCSDCIDSHFSYKPTCPICGTVYGKVTGNQPDGTMHISSSTKRQIQGYEGHGYITVSYDFPDGTQTVSYVWNMVFINITLFGIRDFHVYPNLSSG